MLADEEPHGEDRWSVQGEGEVKGDVKEVCTRQGVSDVFNSGRRSAMTTVLGQTGFGRMETGGGFEDMR